MVLLATEACVMEGGTVVSAAVASVVPSLQLSADSKLAATQQTVPELLMNPQRQNETRPKFS